MILQTPLPLTIPTNKGSTSVGDTDGFQKGPIHYVFGENFRSPSEPKWPMRFVSVMKDTPISSWEYDRMPIGMVNNSIKTKWYSRDVEQLKPLKNDGKGETFLFGMVNFQMRTVKLRRGLYTVYLVVEQNHVFHTCCMYI